MYDADTARELAGRAAQERYDQEVQSEVIGQGLAAIARALLEVAAAIRESK
ncbi:hypothetical protein [Streptomyces sp. NPDC086989]|uniref:hypothetical protein n=1 Tax=Streptomyces sp. NPDC086989 TaxID=3365764 RepID=UPI0038295F7B